MIDIYYIAFLICFLLKMIFHSVQNHDLTGQPVISYIYLCERWYATSLSYFSNGPLMDQKLN